MEKRGRSVISKRGIIRSMKKEWSGGKNLTSRRRKNEKRNVRKRRGTFVISHVLTEFSEKEKKKKKKKKKKNIKQNKNRNEQNLRSCGVGCVDESAANRGSATATAAAAAPSERSGGTSSCGGIRVLTGRIGGMASKNGLGTRLTDRPVKAERGKERI